MGYPCVPENTMWLCTHTALSSSLLSIWTLQVATDKPHLEDQ